MNGLKQGGDQFDDRLNAFLNTTWQMANEEPAASRFREASSTTARMLVSPPASAMHVYSVICRQSPVV